MAEEEVAAHGANASLEQIARTAGVGSATVRRHFPTRRALLEAVSHDRIEVLRARAEALAGTRDGRAALLEWIGDVIASSVRSQGLAAALAFEGAEPESVNENGCATALKAAGAPLLHRAASDGAVQPGVTIDDVMTLIVGVVLATQHLPDPTAEAARLFALTVAGLSPE